MRNSFGREGITDSIHRVAPELHLFFLSCYKAHSSLVYGDFVIDSKEGFEEGYPIASLGFCTVIQPALTCMESRLITWMIYQPTITEKSTA